MLFNTATRRAAPIRSTRSWTTSAQAVRAVAEFWINFQNKFVQIRYFAVRNDEGKYLGTVELTQNLAPLRQLSGERRLLASESTDLH